MLGPLATPRAGATMGRGPTVPRVSRLFAFAQAGPIRSSGGGPNPSRQVPCRRLPCAAVVFDWFGPRALGFRHLRPPSRVSSPGLLLVCPPPFLFFVFFRVRSSPPWLAHVSPHAPLLVLLHPPLLGAAALPGPVLGVGPGGGVVSRWCLVRCHGQLWGWRALGQVSPPTLLCSWAVHGALCRFMDGRIAG